MMIEEGSQVQLHFALKLQDDSIVDSTFEKAPAELHIGDGNLPKAFEQRLIGLSAGDHKQFLLSPEEAFGQHNPSNVQWLSRKQFQQDLEISEGLVVSFADASGSELPGVIKSISDTEVEVDFNHPLAGQSLWFEVNILNCQPGQLNQDQGQNSKDDI